MLAQARTVRRRPLGHPAVFLLPLVLLVVAAIMANLGVIGADRATAATSTVVVNATVSSAVTLTPCGGPVAIAVVTGSLSTGVCSVTFGATNNAALPLQIRDNDGAAPFLAGAGSLPDKAVDCLALGADGVGWKIDSAGLTATNSAACPASLEATNLNYSGMPAALSTVCTTNALGNQVCQLDIGVFDAAPATTAGVYTGTVQFSAV